MSPPPDTGRRALRVGLVVNPVAGLGGPAALKGSDEASWRKALALGYSPTSPERAQRFVAQVGAEASWVTVRGALGGDWCPGAELVGRAAPYVLGETGPADTRDAAAAVRAAKVDLLCFVGGDGTATDVAAAVATTVPCLGVPAGVKITSPVFAHDVEEASWLVRMLAPGFETTLRDVTDVDERAYREGRLDVALTGSLRVPLSPAVPGGKVATSHETTLTGLVEQVLQAWDPAAVHLVGAGSVCMALKEQFWGTPTLLGLDCIDGSRIAQADLTDRDVATRVDAAREVGRRVCVWLSPIGGQGMLLGRGTQMLRPESLRKVGWENLFVVAPPEKLVGLRALHVDSGDPAFDATAPRHQRVIVGWNETRMVRVVHGHPADAAERRPDGPPGAS